MNVGVVARTLPGRPCGYTLLEVVFACGLLVTTSGMALPEVLGALDELRAASAARYLSTRMQRARMDAIARSTEVAIQFMPQAGTFTYAVYRDGNGDGVHSKDIQGGVDHRVGAIERLPDQFSGVDFGVLPGLPAVETGDSPPGNDPIKLGASNLASFSSSGTSSSGSVYIRSRRNAQYVVRLYGTTAKVRVLKFDARAKQWKPL